MRKKIVSLVLGSGGARGMAHIGVIEELESRGYVIRHIAGSSMGAIVGGVYAMGKMDLLKNHLLQQSKMRVFRMMDFVFTNEGLIKGEKIYDELKQLVGDTLIESLPIHYTAVACDLETNQEVWFNKGSILQAMRASAAIPNIVVPAQIGERRLIDGGVVNPTPIEPILHHKADLIIVVNLNATLPDNQHAEGTHEWQRATKAKLFDNKWFENLPALSLVRQRANHLAIVSKVIEITQNRLTHYAMMLHKPDILINISRKSCPPYAFYKAAEQIALGKQACAYALDNYEKDLQHPNTFAHIKDSLYDFVAYQINHWRGK